MSPYERERRRQRTARILGGGMAAAAVVGAIAYGVKQPHQPEANRNTHTRASGAHQGHERHPVKQRHNHTQTEGASATLAVSFQQATHHAAPPNLETVAVPWVDQSWAIDPIGITSTQNPNPTLWFGEKTGTGPWQWIPSTLPGALNPDLPKPIYRALQLAWDLDQGQAGPTLAGSIQWSAITGHVGMPAGWTMQALSMVDSPLGRPTITLTVWMPSFTGSFTGYYGVATAWDVANAVTGDHGLMGLEAHPGPMTAIAGAVGHS